MEKKHVCVTIPSLNTYHMPRHPLVFRKGPSLGLPEKGSQVFRQILGWKKETFTHLKLKSQNNLKLLNFERVVQHALQCA